MLYLKLLKWKRQNGNWKFLSIGPYKYYCGGLLPKSDTKNQKLEKQNQSKMDRMVWFGFLVSNWTSRFVYEEK